MSESNPSPVSPSPSRPPPSAWRLLLRGVEVRLRFLFVLGLLAGLMAGWPWLRAGWERLSSSWQRHDHSAAVSGDTEFFCPMDPGVVSAWPAICPVCNMDLITRKKTDAVLLPEGVVARMQLSPYRVQLAGIRTSAVEARLDSLEQQTQPDQARNKLVVPTAAVVHQGDESVVYVETMPGMFDGVRVRLGPRDGDVYPVLAGLKPGQRVVSVGAFLIDAESRLHPNIATQYFGAGASSRQPESPPRRTDPKKSAEPLSDADLALVKQQQICPVTDAPLGSMGTPVFTMVRGRKVFLCCRGCESGLLADPDKYLTKLKPATNDDAR